MKITFKTIILLILGVAFTISCKKKTDTTPATPMGELWFHLHTDITEAIQNSDVDSLPTIAICDTTNNRKIYVDTAQLILSNVNLINSSNEVTYTLPNVRFKVAKYETVYIGQVPVGEFSSVKYNVGVDSAINSVIATPSDTALYNNTPMYYNGASNPFAGYTFMYFSGYIDTTAGATGIWNGVGQSNSGFLKFSYKIGTNKNLITITIPSNPSNVSSTNPSGQYQVIAGQATYVHQIINYYKIFFGYKAFPYTSSDLTVGPSNPNTAVAQKIISNIITGNGQGSPSNETWYCELGE